MTKIEKSSLGLADDIREVICQCIESSEYANSSGSIYEALRNLKTKRSLQQYDLKVVRKIWQDGIDSGRDRFSDMHAIKIEARNRLEPSAK
jgi:antitoxin ParD1/3/4